jgi:hypothetical protein
MSTNYFVNGQQVNATTAREWLEDRAEEQGYERENYERAWARAVRPEAEESRDFIFEVSGYTLEIVVH